MIDAVLLAPRPEQSLSLHTGGVQACSEPQHTTHTHLTYFVKHMREKKLLQYHLVQ